VAVLHACLNYPGDAVCIILSYNSEKNPMFGICQLQCRIAQAAVYQNTVYAAISAALLATATAYIMPKPWIPASLQRSCCATCIERYGNQEAGLAELR
jgi:hypothetical protein